MYRYYIGTSGFSESVCAWRGSARNVMPATEGWFGLGYLAAGHGKI